MKSLILDKKDSNIEFIIKKKKRKIKILENFLWFNYTLGLHFLLIFITKITPLIKKKINRL